MNVWVVKAFGFLDLLNFIVLPYLILQFFDGSLLHSLLYSHLKLPETSLYLLND